MSTAQGTSRCVGVDGFLFAHQPIEEVFVEGGGVKGPWLKSRDWAEELAVGMRTMIKYSGINEYTDTWKPSFNAHARNITSQNCKDDSPASNAYNLWRNKNGKGVLIAGVVARFSELRAMRTFRKPCVGVSRQIRDMGLDA